MFTKITNQDFPTRWFWAKNISIGNEDGDIDLSNAYVSVNDHDFKVILGVVLSSQKCKF